MVWLYNALASSSRYVLVGEVGNETGGNVTWLARMVVRPHPPREVTRASPRVGAAAQRVVLPVRLGQVKSMTRQGNEC